MTSQEIEAVKQSVSDGFWSKNGSKPSDREVRLCVKFFLDMKTDDIAVNLLEMILTREVLISGWDTERKEPRFINNKIKTH